MTQDQALLGSPGVTSGPGWGRLRDIDRRATGLVGVLLAGWWLTGLVVVRVDQRAVYERFGAPVAVLHPGLHLVLPWPFSHVRRVDFGDVREVAIGAAPGVRVLYRVGMTDSAAMDAAYGSSDPGGVAQAAGGRAMAGGAVDAGRLREAIQSALDGLDSGIEVVGLVGAPAVAGAGDEARAAAITGQALVAQARSAAEIERAEARQTAAATVAGARAKAAEMVAAARSGLVEFTADRAANQADSKSFLLERYFANLSKAIGTSPKTIIDHRLNWPTAPELDLRPPAGVGVPGAASGLGKGN